MLTDAHCRAAKPKEQLYRLNDFRGLYLEVKPNGVKAWRYRFKLAGKGSWFALGDYPSVSLAEARDKCEEARKLVKQGINPVQNRQVERIKREQDSANTFEAVAKEWLALKDWEEVTKRRRLDMLQRVLALEELEHDAAALAKVIKGEQADISRLRQKRTAAQLVKTLCMFGIPCGTRNDHDVDVRNVTTAMRCVMFSMLEAGSKNLSWSTTASIIKLGIRVQTDPSENRVLPLEGLQAVTQAGEDALRLFMLEEPLWNGIRLET